MVYTGSYNLIIRSNPYIVEITSPVTGEQNYTMNDLNPLYYAVIDHKNKYHTIDDTKEYIQF